METWFDSFMNCEIVKNFLWRSHVTKGLVFNFFNFYKQASGEQQEALRKKWSEESVANHSFMPSVELVEDLCYLLDNYPKKRKIKRLFFGLSSRLDVRSLGIGEPKSLRAQHDLLLVMDSLVARFHQYLAALVNDYWRCDYDMIELMKEFNLKYNLKSVKGSEIILFKKIKDDSLEPVEHFVEALKILFQLPEDEKYKSWLVLYCKEFVAWLKTRLPWGALYSFGNIFQNNQVSGVLKINERGNIVFAII